MITLDNLSGEMLTDIRALADRFLIALPNINSRFLITSMYLQLMYVSPWPAADKALAPSVCSLTSSLCQLHVAARLLQRATVAGNGEPIYSICVCSYLCWSRCFRLMFSHLPSLTDCSVVSRGANPLAKQLLPFPPRTAAAQSDHVQKETTTRVEDKRNYDFATVS